jgi:hypothetical protein
MTVRLPADLYEWLRREAFEEHVSQAAIVVEALTIYRDKLTKEARA